MKKNSKADAESIITEEKKKVRLWVLVGVIV